METGGFSLISSAFTGRLIVNRREPNYKETRFAGETPYFLGFYVALKSRIPNHDG